MPFDPTAPVEVEDFDPSQPVEVESENLSTGEDTKRRFKRGLAKGLLNLREGIVRAGETVGFDKLRSEEEKKASKAREEAGNTPYQRAERILERKDQAPDPNKDETLLAQGSEIAGGVLPVLASGPVAPVTGGLQMGGGAAKDAKDAGLSEEEQNRRFKINTVIGTAANAIPGLSKAPIGRFVEKAGGGKVIREIAKVTGSAAEGAAVNTAADAATQLAEKKTLDLSELDTKRLKQNAGIGAAAGAVAPTRKGGVKPKAEPAPKFDPNEPIAVHAGNKSDVEVNGQKVPTFDPDAPIDVDTTPVKPDAAAEPSTNFPVEDALAVKTETPEKVAGAAFRRKSGEVLTGKSHFDILNKLDPEVESVFMKEGPEDGFVTDKGRFVSREEAAEIVKKSDPDVVLRDDGGLSSESIDQPEPVVPKKGAKVAIDDDAAIEAAAAAQTPKREFQFAVYEPDVKGPDGKRIVQIAETTGGGDGLGPPDAATRATLPVVPDDMPAGNYTLDEVNAYVASKKAPTAAPVAKPATSGVPVERYALPKELSRAKPRYSYGDKRFTVKFANDLDKALYTVASDAKKSARDADFIASLTTQLGVTETEARAAGQKIKAAIKAMAKDAEAGELVVPASAAFRDAPAPGSEPIVSNPPLGRVPKTRQEIGYELGRYTRGAETIMKAFEDGDPETIITAARGSKAMAGNLQSAYHAMKQQGLIPEHVDRNMMTALLNEDRDLFRMFDSAESLQGVGIVGMPDFGTPAELIDATAKAGKLSWKAAKEALFNTTGGVSKYIFERVQRMQGNNARMMEEIKRLSQGISKSFGGKMTPEQQTVASAYLNPSRLSGQDKAVVERIQKAMEDMTPAQRSALDDARARIDSMTKELVDLGVPKKEFSEIMTQNIGRYVSRAYEIFGSNGEEYIRNLTTPGTKAYNTRYQPAVAQFGKDFVDKLINLISRRGELSRQEVDGLVKDQIKNLGSSVALSRSVREQAIRSLFGEIIDPVQSVAYTLAKQQELASTYRFRAQVRSHLENLGLARKVDVDKVVQDYIANEAAVIKETADARVAEAARNRGGDMPPEIEEAIRRQVAEDRPTFSARADARTKALMTDALTRGEKGDLQAATKKAEQEIFREYEENALNWFNRSGEVKGNETLVRLDPVYKADMAMSGRVNDPFADIIVDNSALPLLQEYRKLEPQAMNLLQEFATITNTGATVFAPMTTIRNIITSNQALLSSGNILRSLGTDKGRDAWKSAMEIAKHRVSGKTLPSELSGLYNELMENGVLNKGALSGDTANIVDAGRGVLRRASKVGRILKNEEKLNLGPLTEKSKRIRPEEAIAKMSWGDEKWWETLGRKAQDVYQLGDDTPKIVNYLMEKQKAAEAGLSAADAQRKFNMTNYDYSRVIPIVRAVRKFPVIGGFTSFISETYRVALNSISLGIEDAVQGVKTGNKALVKQGVERLAGVSAALGTAAIAAEMSRDALGLSYEDERKLKEFLPEWDRNSHIYWYRTGDGKIDYINLGNNALFSALTRPATAVLQRVLNGEVEGDPNATVGQEIQDQMWEAVQPFLSYQISAQAVKEAISGQQENGVPIWAADDGAGDKWVKSLGHVISKTLQPGVLKNAKQVAQGLAGETNRRGEEISPTKPLESLAGVGSINGEQAVKYFSRERGRTLRGIEGEFKRMVEDRSTGVTEEAIYEKLAEVNERRRQHFLELSQGVEAALLMGTEKAAIISQLREQGFNQRELAAIMSGRYEPYTPSQETLIRARKVGRPLNFKRVQEIVKASRS